jgi:CheY-like chemotaxis protein/nitrogen-specific signal transduction histidine kinase
MTQMREANENLVIAAIHAQEMAETAERSSRDKEQFLAMLAHELRNPLAPMVGAIAVLRRLTHADPKLPWIHDVLKRQVEHLTQLLNDLLEVSRISGGKVVLKVRAIETSEFMLRAIEASRPLILSRKQRLTVELPVEPLIICGDPTRLPQIFGNLLNNASKYTPEGGSITFSGQPLGDSVALRVSDNGVGIASEALPRIFEMFTQEHRSLDRSQGGLGIGLTVARSLVELHGGKIEATSPGEGRGSDFVVTFPLLKNTPAALLETGSAGVEVPGERHHVVVIEDNVDANDSLKMVLEVLGHEVFPAFDGKAGVALVREKQPDIVLCDIGLPGQDGYQVIASLKKTMSPMPIMIALTGYGQAEDRVRALAAGFDHHLVKPVDIEALLRLIAGRGASPG